MKEEPHQLAIGVDLGATKIASALVTRTGRVLGSRQTPTLADAGPADVCNRLAREILALMQLASPETVAGVGIGSPGLVDGRAGVVRTAVNLRWDQLPLADEISRRIARPVWIENDASASALAEGYFGSAARCADYVLLTVGSGLGCGVVSGGRLITGANLMAAELGHYSIDPDEGRLCACGKRGCAETIASGQGLVAVARQILSARSQPSTMIASDNLSPEHIVRAARAGDVAAIEALRIVGRAIGEVAAIAAAVIDPEVIVLGGGLGIAAADLLTASAARELSRRLPSHQIIPPIRPATVSNSALGAACLVWRAVGFLE